MPCSLIKLPGGGVAIVKHAAPRRKRCGTCRASAPFLCDWKMNASTAPEQTCDASLCAKHALEVEPDKHLCPLHQSAWRAHPLFRP